MSDYLGDSGPVDEISQDSDFSRGGRSGGRTSLTRGAKFTALTTALAVVVAGGVVTAAWRSFQSHGGPEKLIPSSAFAVGTLDLSMRGHGDALAAFANHFPGSPTHHGDGSAVDRLLRAAFRASSDPHVDYDRDIKPWLGDHVALAGWMDKAGKPEMEGLIQSTDDSAARAEMRKLMTNGNGAFRIADGYVVLGDTDALVRESIDAAHRASLADNNAYAGDTDALPGDPALTAWVDGPSARKAIEAAMSPDEAKLFERMGSMGPLGMFGPLSLMGAARAGGGGATAGALGAGRSPFSGRTAIGVRVDDRYLEVDARSTGGPAQHGSSTKSLRALPASTIAAFELGDPSALVTGMTSAMKLFGGFTAPTLSGCSGTVEMVPPASSVPQNLPNRRQILRELARQRRKLHNASPCVTRHIQPPDPLQQIETATGLQLPGDAAAVLGDSLLASYGGLTLQGLPNVAVRTHPADLSAAQAVLDKVQSRLPSSAHVPLTVDTSGGDLLLATSSDYVHEVEQTGSFGEQSQVQLALGGLPDTVGSAGYVDLSKILPLLGSVPRDVQALKAVGFWTAVAGGVQTSQLRIVVG
ncbi:MAG TPA: hypothetical protein VFH66_04285 [Mycobacteriales bacterium]|nr:hypothetical protein [Mycobacteriales bacterium]